MNLRESLLEKPWAVLKRQRILRDRFLRWFLLAAIALFVAIWVLLGLRLRPSDFVVPIGYTSGLEFTFGDWYRIYEYGLFSLLVTFGNIAMATISFEKSRIASFFLVVGAVVVNAFTLVVLYNLLSQIG